MKLFQQKLTTSTYSVGIAMHDKNDSCFHFRGGINMPKTTFGISNRGNVYIYNVNGVTNVWFGTSFTSGQVHAMGAYALPTTAGSAIKIGAYGRMDLHGYNQKIPRFYTATDRLTDDEYLRSSGSTPTTLEVAAVQSDKVLARVIDALTFVWNPTAAYTMTFSRTRDDGTKGGDLTCTTTGDLIVSNGTICLSGAVNFNKLVAVRVSDGAKFQMDSGTSLNTKAKLYIYGTGQIVLPAGMTIEVADVYVDGEQQEHGETFSGKSWISGGSVYITDTIVQSAATWDGGAGAADTSVGTAANWSDDTLPDLTTGGLTATFATGGATATVDRAVKLYKASFSAADGFTLADGGGTLQIGKGGLTTSVAATNRFDTPVVLNGAQTWTVAPANASVVAEEALSSPLGGVLTKAGAGSLTLKGANTFTGNLEVNAGIVYLTGANATAGSSDVGQVSVGTGGKLYLNNAVLNRPLVCAPTGDYYGVGQLDAVAGTDNLVLGDVVVTQNGNTGRNLNLWPEEKARLVLAGGVSYAAFLFANGPGEVVFSNKIFNCSKVGTYGYSQTPTIRFQVAGNTTSADASGATSRDMFTLGDTARPTVHFEVSNVFAANNGYYPTLKGPTSSSGSATVYLHGTTQRFDGLLADYANATVTSTEPGAVLNIMQWTAATNLWAVNGHVSINKWGTSELAFGRSGATADNFAVSEGTLRILPAAKFPNLTALAASSSGVLAIEATDAISKNCDITLDGTSAKLNLNFNGTLKCGRLLMRNALNELRPVAAGVYGAKGSGAPRELANITGTGLLFVRKPSGFMMFFK